MFYIYLTSPRHCPQTSLTCDFQTQALFFCLLCNHVSVCNCVGFVFFFWLGVGWGTRVVGVKSKCRRHYKRKKNKPCFATISKYENSYKEVVKFYLFVLFYYCCQYMNFYFY